MSDINSDLTRVASLMHCFSQLWCRAPLPALRAALVLACKACRAFKACKAPRVWAARKACKECKEFKECRILPEELRAHKD